MKYTIPVTCTKWDEWLVPNEYADMFRQEINKGDSIDLITDTGEVVSFVVDEGRCGGCVCNNRDMPCIVFALCSKDADVLNYADTTCVFRDKNYMFKDRHKMMEEL